MQSRPDPSPIRSKAYLTRRVSGFGFRASDFGFVFTQVLAQARVGNYLCAHMQPRGR
jgi:hypothetical protein